MKKKFFESLNFLLVCLIMGTTCFGGGYAMIPIMEKEFAEKRKYVTVDELTEIVAIGQSLPGLISLNTLIILSYRRAGILGVIMSMLGLVIPSVVIITLVYFIYENIIGNKFVDAALLGIKGGVIGILIYAIYKMWKSSVKRWFHFVIVGVTIVLALFTPLNPIYVILIVGGSFIVLFILSELIFKTKWNLERGKNEGVDQLIVNPEQCDSKKSNNPVSDDERFNVEGLDVADGEHSGKLSKSETANYHDLEAYGENDGEENKVTQVDEKELSGNSNSQVNATVRNRKQVDKESSNNNIDEHLTKQSSISSKNSNDEGEL